MSRRMIGLSGAQTYSYNIWWLSDGLNHPTILHIHQKILDKLNLVEIVKIIISVAKWPVKILWTLLAITLLEIIIIFHVQLCTLFFSVTNGLGLYHYLTMHAERRRRRRIPLSTQYISAMQFMQSPLLYCPSPHITAHPPLWPFCVVSCRLV